MRWLAMRWVLVVLVVCWASVAGAQQEVTLSPAQVNRLAEQAVVAGDFATAEQLSAVVLAGDPENARALLVRAAVARAAGVLDDAAALGAEAHGLSDDPAVRFEAAMLVADVRARQERFTTAQWWLRRADQVATDERRRTIVANAFRVVNRANPLSVQLRFGVQPSSNVNNGAEVETITVGGIPGFNVAEEDQQLGGYEASLGVSLGYRLSEDETQRTDLLGEVFYRKVWLDSDAKDKAPDAEGSDFDYGVLVVGARHARLIWPDLGPTRVTGLVGQSWYGGEDLSRWGEVQLSQVVRQGEAAQLTFGLSMRAESQFDRPSTTSDDTINSNHSLTLSLDRVQIIDGRRLSYGGSLKRWWSDSATVESRAASLRASWDLGDMFGTRPTLSGSLERRIFDEFSSGRSDWMASLGVSMTFPEYSYFGFVPQVTLNGRRTWSSFDLYDRTSYSLGITAVSRF